MKKIHISSRSWSKMSKVSQANEASVFFNFMSQNPNVKLWLERTYGINLGNESHAAPVNLQSIDTRTQAGRTQLNQILIQKMGLQVGDKIKDVTGTYQRVPFFEITQINPDFSLNLSDESTGRLMGQVNLFTGGNKPHWQKI